jgi:putative DNA primase/helicase
MMTDVHRDHGIFEGGEGSDAPKTANGLAQLKLDALDKDSSDQDIVAAFDEALTLDWKQDDAIDRAKSLTKRTKGKSKKNSRAGLTTLMDKTMIARRASAMASPPKGIHPVNHMKGAFTDGQSLLLPSEGEDGRIEYARISGYIEPLCFVRSREEDKTQDWKLRVRFLTHEGSMQTEDIPREDILERNGMGPLLLNRGMDIELNGLKHLNLLLSGAKPERVITSVPRRGWRGDVFIINGDDEFELDRRLEGNFSQAGTLDDWKKNVAGFCGGNALAMFGITTMFVSPLLPWLSVEADGVYHIVGATSSGKTSILRAAASVWGRGERGSKGGFIQSWLHTGNHLELMCEGHNHIGLTLDELSQLSPDAAADIAYKIAHGTGKGRMRADGGSRTTKTWRVVGLSSGEKGLDHLVAMSRRGGGRSRLEGGAEVRFVSIPADGYQYRAFSELHGCADGGEYAVDLERRTNKYYGVAGPAFVDKLAKNFRQVETFTDPMRVQLLQRMDPHMQGTSDQARRVAGRFVSVMLAGCLAAHWKILPWSPVEITDAVEEVFHLWKKAHDDAKASSDTEAAWRRIQNAFQRHETNRFTQIKITMVNRKGETDIKRKAPEISEEWGWHVEGPGKKDNDGHVEIKSAVMRDQILDGFNTNAVMKELVALGRLLPDQEDRYTNRRKISGVTHTVYRLPEDLLR